MGLSAKAWWTIVIVALVVVFLILFLTGTFTGQAAATTQCKDRIDNDGDGKCDYISGGKSCTDGSVKGDTGCSSLQDTTEASCVRGSTTCGVGVCFRSSICVNDQVSCTPGTPQTEVCDSMDNDCDGSTDEGGVCTNFTNGTG